MMIDFLSVVFTWFGIVSRYGRCSEPPTVRLQLKRNYPQHKS